MNTKLRACAALLATTAVFATTAIAASASPGAGSVSAEDGSAVYMVTPQGSSTIVTKLRGSDRTALVKTRLRGQFEVPAVAGESTGLSHDGQTLVLGDHPSADRTAFALIDTTSLKVRKTLLLRGDYSFDAMSPDASTIYLIKFLSSDGRRYAIQALDMTASEPVAKTVVEKGEPGERMSGLPVSRSTSPDGGWVYTLYNGAEGAPFIHALSTVDKFTMCIDLDALAGRPDIASMTTELTPDAKTLAVTAGGEPVALMNTKSFEVTEPAAAAAPPTAATPPAEVEKRGENSFPWLLVLGL